MTDLLHPVSDQPPAASDRPPAVPEIHRLAMRETAVIAVDVAQDELPDAIGAAIGEVEAAMREAGVGLGGPPFARYLAFEPRIRAEIGFPVQRPAPHVGRVFPGRLPGGRVASIVHIGPYDGLEQHVRPDAPLARRAGPRAQRADLGGLLERPRDGARPGDLADGDLRADRVAPGGPRRGPRLAPGGRSGPCLGAMAWRHRPRSRHRVRDRRRCGVRRFIRRQRRASCPGMWRHAPRRPVSARAIPGNVDLGATGARRRQVVHAMRQRISRGLPARRPSAGARSRA